MLHPLPPPNTDVECPYGDECPNTHNARDLRAAQNRIPTLESTRSHDGESAWRDMDGFDVDEELARLRSLVHLVRRMNPDGFERHQAWKVVCDAAGLDVGSAPTAPELLAAIAMMFDNIDENLVRLGPLPKAWHHSSTVANRRR